MIDLLSVGPRSEGVNYSQQKALQTYTLTRRTLIRDYRRLQLHAIHLTQSHSCLIVKYNHTYIVWFNYYASQWLFATFTPCILDMAERKVWTNLLKNLDVQCCDCLPACHAFPGYNTINSLHRKGKTTAFYKAADPSC